MNTQSLKENGRKGGQKRAAAYHQRFETVIHLEDRGQDFLRLIVRESVVVAAEPFQGWIWEGSTIVSKPQIGRCLKLKRGPLSATLSHPVIRLERRARAQATKVQP